MLFQIISCWLRIVSGGCGWFWMILVGCYCRSYPFLELASYETVAYKKCISKTVGLRYNVLLLLKGCFCIYQIKIYKKLKKLLLINNLTFKSIYSEYSRCYIDKLWKSSKENTHDVVHYQ